MRELAGHIGVDSGQVMLLDPCYIPKNWDDEFHVHTFEREAESQPAPKNLPLSYDSACRVTLSSDGFGELGEYGGGLAFCTGTTHGDGLYPVYIERNSDGKVTSLTVEFDQLEEDDEFSCQRCGTELRFGDDAYCDRCEALIAEADEEADREMAELI